MTIYAPLHNAVVCCQEASEREYRDTQIDLEIEQIQRAWRYRERVQSRYPAKPQFMHSMDPIINSRSKKFHNPRLEKWIDFLCTHYLQEMEDLTLMVFRVFMQIWFYVIHFFICNGLLYYGNQSQNNLTVIRGLKRYNKGLFLQASVSSSCRLTVSRLADDRTLISSRVIALDPWDLVVTSNACTSGRLFLRCRVPAGVSCGRSSKTQMLKLKG